jgi:hypothetical protein
MIDRYYIKDNFFFRYEEILEKYETLEIGNNRILYVDRSICDITVYLASGQYYKKIQTWEWKTFDTAHKRFQVTVI